LMRWRRVTTVMRWRRVAAALRRWWIAPRRWITLLRWITARWWRVAPLGRGWLIAHETFQPLWVCL
jgi:hypothetical protein